MKRLVLCALASTMLVTAGCGQRSMVPASAPVFFSQPRLDYGSAKVTSPKTSEAPVAPVAETSSLDKVRDDFRQVAQYGPIIQDLETLGADLDDEEVAYGVLASPDSTQGKAIKLAKEWASDAEQLYLGWGFKWLTVLGHSRHVFWSPSKKKLLTLDYGVWGTLKDQYETENLAMKYAGGLVRQLLREPNDTHAFNGKEAFNRAKKAGLQAPAQGAIKAILIEAYFIGPVWIFFDYRNEPAMFVNANDGRVISDSLVLDILKYLL